MSAAWSSLWRRAGTVSLLLGLWAVGTGCTTGRGRQALPGGLTQAALAELGGRAGAVLIFDPRSCTLGSALLDRLNAVSTQAPLRVRGVLLAELPGDSARAALGRDLGIAFPLVEDSRGQWRTQLVALGLAQPVLLVLKHGTVQAVLSGQAAEQLDGELPGLELASSGPP